ncbi:MAG: hypothetical protein [Circular genetic element sp.]|nr:MAG: hypothetical protein [Circular genetic element sp.]
MPFLRILRILVSSMLYRPTKSSLLITLVVYRFALSALLRLMLVFALGMLNGLGMSASMAALRMYSRLIRFASPNRLKPSRMPRFCCLRWFLRRLRSL